MGRHGGQGELVVLERAYALVAELVPRVHKLPRTYRFTLGDRIENAALDVLLVLTDARWRRDRRALLDRANALLDRLRCLLRLAFDLRLVSLRVLALLSERVDEVGRLVGAWRRTASRA